MPKPTREPGVDRPTRRGMRVFWRSWDGTTYVVTNNATDWETDQRMVVFKEARYEWADGAYLRDHEGRTIEGDDDGKLARGSAVVINCLMGKVFATRLDTWWEQFDPVHELDRGVFTAVTDYDQEQGGAS